MVTTYMFSVDRNLSSALNPDYGVHTICGTVSTKFTGALNLADGTKFVCLFLTIDLLSSQCVLSTNEHSSGH